MTSRRLWTHRPRLFALSITLMLTLAVSACPGGDTEETPTPTPTTVPVSGITTETPTPTATIDPGLQGEDLEVAIWGSRVCGLTRTFASDFLASGDPRNPQELSLAERKERATSIFPGQFGAVEAALDQLSLIEPPERTAALHELLRQTYEGLRDALRDQEVIIEAAARPTRSRSATSP